MFLAGLGALANAQKMGTETFETLVKDGEKFRKETSKKTEKLIDEVQDSIRDMSDDAQARAEGLMDRVRGRSKLDKFQTAFDKRVARDGNRGNRRSARQADLHRCADQPFAVAGLEADGRRATFLPKVWEQLPDPREFLRHLRRKAGLPETGWPADLRVSRYGATTFSSSVRELRVPPPQF